MRIGTAANDDVLSKLKSFDGRTCFLCFQRLVKWGIAVLKIVTETTGFSPISCAAAGEVTLFPLF